MNLWNRIFIEQKDHTEWKMDLLIKQIQFPLRIIWMPILLFSFLQHIFHEKGEVTFGLIMNYNILVE